MIHDFQRKIVYRLIPTTAWDCIAKHRATFAKARYTKASNRAKHKAIAEAEAAKKMGKEAPPQPPQPPKPAVLLCQSKVGTLNVIYRLALKQAGVITGNALGPRTPQRTAKLRKHGVSPKLKRPKPKVYQHHSKVLVLTTSQPGLSASCDNDVRSLQRHLDDLEAVGVLLERRRLPRGKFPTDTYQLVLDGSFLDWQEVRVYANGTTVADGADRPPVAPTQPAQGEKLPSSGPEPPGALAAQLAALLAPHREKNRGTVD